MIWSAWKLAGLAGLTLSTRPDPFLFTDLLAPTAGDAASRVSTVSNYGE
ncbi:MAG: hypothetical protein ABSG07_03335 [Terriglobales bacterium]